MDNQTPSKTAFRVGWTLSGIAIAFLTFDGVLKFFLHKMPPEAMADAAKLAYPMNIMPGIGATLLVCVLFYAIPHTAILGAILLTGYLGGAVSAHVRIMNPWPSHILFPVYFGVLIWLGLYLRIPALRSFIPMRKAP